MNRRVTTFFWVAGCTLALAVSLAGAPASAQDVCPGDFCDEPQDSICDAGGFKITQTGYEPASTSNSGIASYTYELCSPSAGVCNGTARFGEACEDNDFCRKKGRAEDPTATCSRECAVDTFHGLSHFDIGFPAPGLTCVGQNAVITGSCSNGNFTLGDGSCPSFPNVAVAKCDNTTLAVGSCMTMTVNIPGEENAPGLGSVIVVSKAGSEQSGGGCNASCLLGPACGDDICEEDPRPDDQCLTRTRGFWSTHPHLIAGADPRSMNLLPVTVCGAPLASTAANSCSTSEALCTSNSDRSSNPAYLSLAAQLTAAKLNLKATKKLIGEPGCNDWELDDTGIRDWISYCETFCGASKQAISGSGCIEALDAFNNSLDTGFDVTPSPFDQPGPAQAGQCQLARGNKKSVGAGGGLPSCP